MNHPVHRSVLRSALKLSTVLALAWSGAAGAQTYTQGIADNFNLPTEPVSPSPGLQTWVSNNYSIPGIRPFDYQGNDRYFATTFPNLKANGRICGATLRMTVRNGDSNDSMGLLFINSSGGVVDPGWGASLISLGIPLGGTSTLSLNLASLPGTGMNLLPTLNTLGSLDVIVQDDSAVDFAALTITPCRDVFIRDIVGDVGVEPGSYGSTPIWMSPDIRVCQSPGCAGNENPEFGQPNYIYVKLNNVGTPASPTPQPTSGTLNLYYTASGGAATWPGSWTYINSIAVNSLPTGSTEWVVPWTNVPSPGHYCLLAVWYSPTDPITFPLLNGSNTLVSTAQNNNIAWRNVNVVNLSPLRPTASFDFRVLNVLAQRPTQLDLEIRPSSQASFIRRGQVLLKLDDKLRATWSGRGTGFEIQPDGLVRITNPSGARLMGMTLAPGAEAHATVTFKADAGTQRETFEMQVVQHSESDTSGDKIVEQGGVGYTITVSPDAKP
jgi:hypothetical protein